MKGYNWIIYWKYYFLVLFSLWETVFKNVHARYLRQAIKLRLDVSLSLTPGSINKLIANINLIPMLKWY